MEGLADEFDWSGYNDDDGADGKKTIGEVVNGESEVALSASSITKANNDGSDKAKKKPPPPQGIAMFCTGGIRCEKATSYAIQSNLFPKDLPIYHLEGGILAYLDDVAKRDANDVVDETKNEGSDGNKLHQGNVTKEQENGTSSKSSTFRGECFVFDKRVAVKEGLKPSSNYISCHGCRGPMDHRLLSPSNDNLDTKINDGEGNTKNYNAEKNEAAKKYQALAQGIPNLPALHYDTTTKRHYLPGLTCPRCHSSTTRESLERFASRERQIDICKREGKAHFLDQGMDQKQQKE